ncbi:MAG: hemin uptake protein HemP [Rubrivivax sp.]|nr:hemin uptake protein HemP [Rubrivivax sp.]
MPGTPPGATKAQPLTQAERADLPPSPAAGRRRLDSSELFGDAQEIEIVHRQQVYRLRRTALDKLILTK